MDIWQVILGSNMEKCLSNYYNKRKERNAKKFIVILTPFSKNCGIL